MTKNHVLEAAFFFRDDGFDGDAHLGDAGDLPPARQAGKGADQKFRERSRRVLITASTQRATSISPARKRPRLASGRQASATLNNTIDIKRAASSSEYNTPTDKLSNASVNRFFD